MTEKTKTPNKIILKSEGFSLVAGYGVFERSATSEFANVNKSQVVIDYEERLELAMKRVIDNDL